jgi:hypothetical protein
MVKFEFEKRLAIVWLGLAAITVISFCISTLNGQQVLRANSLITLSVITISLVKVRFILSEFMEVRHAPVLLCRLTDVWILFTAAALLGTYFVGMAYSTG